MGIQNGLSWRYKGVSISFGVRHEAVLPWELKLDSWRVTFQNQLTADEYSALMKDELEDLAGHQLKALRIRSTGRTDA